MAPAAASAPAAVDLQGEAIGELCAWIPKLIDRDDLDYLLRVKLNFILARELDTSKAYDPLVFALILRLMQLGIIVEFLRAMLDARPLRTDFRDVVKTYVPQALDAAPAAQVAADIAAVGLDAVKQRLDDPNVRSLVTPHRDELARLMIDIEVLANYKNLHDIVQTIQLTHLPQMTADMLRLRTDPTAVATLETHVFQLEDLCGNAFKAASALPAVAAVPAAELGWVNKLKSAIDQIRQAVETSDDREGGRALRALRALIRLQSYRINSLLLGTAGGLPLEQLVVIVTDVVKATPGDDASSVEIRNGLQSLQSMLPLLKGQVIEHDQWQAVEMELFAAEDFLEQGTPDSVLDFRDTWNALKQSVAALAGTQPEAPWAKRSQDLAKSIDAVAPLDLNDARSNFALFRNNVLFHFFQLDRALRVRCGAIQTLAVPLKSLLSKVG